MSAKTSEKLHISIDELIEINRHNLEMRQQEADEVVRAAKQRIQ